MAIGGREEIIRELQRTLGQPGGRQALRLLVNAVGGAVPFAGGVASGAVAYWAEREQSEINNALAAWVEDAEQDIARLSRLLAELLAEPTKASMALALGGIVGNEAANSLFAKNGSAVAAMLNPSSVAELERYIEQGWLIVQPTGSMTNLGAGNRVGNHIEDKKRPYGMGSGYLLQVTPEGSTSER